MPTSQGKACGSGLLKLVQGLPGREWQSWGPNPHPANLNPYSPALLRSLQRWKAEFKAGEPQHRKQELPAPKPVVSSALTLSLLFKVFTFCFYLSPFPIDHPLSTWHFPGEPSLSPTGLWCPHRHSTVRAGRGAARHPSRRVLLNVFPTTEKVLSILFQDKESICSTQKDGFPQEFPTQVFINREIWKRCTARFGH